MVLTKNQTGVTEEKKKKQPQKKQKPQNQTNKNPTSEGNISFRGLVGGGVEKRQAILHEFEANLVYTEKPCFKKPKKGQTKIWPKVNICKTTKLKHTQIQPNQKPKESSQSIVTLFKKILFSKY